jgi:hypothetical protein
MFKLTLNWKLFLLTIVLEFATSSYNVTRPSVTMRTQAGDGCSVLEINSFTVWLHHEKAYPAKLHLCV